MKLSDYIGEATEYDKKEILAKNVSRKLDEKA